MTEQDDDKELGIKVLAIANVVRKVVLLGNKKIAEAIEESPFDEHEVAALTEFVDMFAQGYHKEHIVESLKISPELVERLDRMNLNW